MHNEPLERRFGAVGLVWTRQEPQLVQGYEPRAGCLIWRASVTCWYGPHWTVTTEAGEQPGNFATARDAADAVDAAFERARA